MSDVLKGVRETVTKQDTKIDKLENELIQLKKQRAAPATVPADAEGERVTTSKRNQEKVSWSADMNTESWGDED